MSESKKKSEEEFSSFLNKMSPQYELSDKDKQFKLSKLNTDIGNLELIIRQKFDSLLTMFNGPFAYDNHLQIFYYPSETKDETKDETKEVVDDAKTDAEKTQDKPYTNISIYSKYLFSTARIITNSLKNNEEIIKNTFSKELIDDIESKLVDLYKNELQLYKKIKNIEQLQFKLQSGGEPDTTVKKIKYLVENARDNYIKTHEDRKNLLSIIKTNNK